MKLLEILKKMLSCSSPQVTSEESKTSVSTSGIAKWESSANGAELDDIRLVVGDNTLTLVYNVCLGGLHNVLSYDPCSGALQDCFAEINSIISKNFEEAYDSIVIKTGENQYLLNIGVNLQMGNGSLSQKLCEDLIHVFYPIIKRFVKEYVVDNKVGIYTVFTDEEIGTSVGLLGLVNHLKKDGYVCSGVGTAYRHGSFSLKRAKGWENFTFVDLGELLKGKEKLPKANILPLLHDELIANMQGDIVCSQNVKQVQFTSHKSSEIMEQYGQVRTMADILIDMNEKYHFSNSEEAVDAVESFIGSQSLLDFTISGKAFQFIADALHSPKAFENGRLNKDAFIENFTVSQFGKSWDNAMYRYYYAKIWKLICYFNEFRKYTSPKQIYKDLERTIAPEYYKMDNPWGRYPQYFFRRAIEEAWSEIAPNNAIDSNLLDEYMFKHHETSLKAIGIEETIKKYYVQDYCHADVYFPKKVGSGPVYNEKRVGNKRMFIKSCGEGKGPNNCPELLEIGCAYKLLLEESKYEVLARSLGLSDEEFELVFVPQKDISLPIYTYEIYGYRGGKVLFENIEAKKKFIKKMHKDKERFLLTNDMREKVIKYSRL